MAGLMTAIDQRNNAVAPGGTRQEPADDAQEMQYRKFVTNGMRALHSKGALKTAMQVIKSAPNPALGLANVVVSLVTRLVDSAEAAGKQIDGDMLEQGGAHLLEQIADIASKSGIHNFTQDEINHAAVLAADSYRALRQQQGKLPQEQAQQEFAALQQADKSGQLDLSSIGKLMGGAQPQGAPSAPGGPPAPTAPAPTAAPTQQRRGMLA